MRYSIYSIIFVLSLTLAAPLQSQTSWLPGPQEQVLSATSQGQTSYVLTEKAAYKSSDDLTWQKLRSSRTGEFLNSIVVLSTGEIFLFGYSSYILSTDDGASWNTVKQSGFSTRTAIADHADILYAGENDPIQISTDKGKTWSASSNGTNSNFFDIGVLKLAPNGDVYAGNQGITGGYVYRTSNGGKDWTLVHQRSMEDVADLTIHNGSVYIAYSNDLDYSDDDGATWNTSLTKSPMYLRSILFVGENDGFLGTGSVGLFRTQDRGNSWENGTVTGIHGKQVPVLITTSRGNVLAGTDSGLFILRLQAGVKEQVNNTGNLSLFPNPAPPFSTVNLSIPTMETTHIEIFNELGEKENVVWNKKIGGAEETEWTGSIGSLQPGSYFVRVTGGEYQQTVLLHIK